MALVLLDEFQSSELIGFVIAGNHKELTRAKGVGPKLAQRIVLELKDKVTKLSVSSGLPMGFVTNDGGIPSAAGHASEAIGALSVLGYTPTEAASVVSKFDSSLPTEELIRLSLKEMAARMG